MLNFISMINTVMTHRGSRLEGLKGISVLIFWNSSLKIKLKGENALCSFEVSVLVFNLYGEIFYS